MKLTIKLFLIISLFCSTALADGDMSEGSLADGSREGGVVCVECVIDDQEENYESIYKAIQHFLMDLIG